MCLTAFIARKLLRTKRRHHWARQWMCRVFMGNYGPNDLAQIVYFSSLQNKKEKKKTNAQQFTIIVVIPFAVLFFLLGPFTTIGISPTFLFVGPDVPFRLVMMCFLFNSISPCWLFYFLDGQTELPMDPPPPPSSPKEKFYYNNRFMRH